MTVQDQLLGAGCEIESPQLATALEHDRPSLVRPRRVVSAPSAELLAGAVHVDEHHVPGAPPAKAHPLPLAPEEKDPLAVRRETWEEVDVRVVGQLADGLRAEIEEIQLVVAASIGRPDNEPIERPSESRRRFSLRAGERREALP